MRIPSVDGGGVAPGGMKVLVHALGAVAEPCTVTAAPTAVAENADKPDTHAASTTAETTNRREQSLRISTTVTVITPDGECREVGNVIVVFVRDAAVSDLPEITAIYNALLETTTHEWTEMAHTVAEREEWLSAQRASGRPALVAVDGTDVVGWATYGDFRDSERWPGYRFTVEHSIHVREDHRGRGVGRALINALIERARSEDKHVMVAGIDADNTGSIRFHERLGFVEVGRLPEIGEKFGRRLDLVLMQLVLDDRPA